MIETIEADFARRLRDVERAGHLRGLLASAETGAWESWRFCRYTLRDDEAARAHFQAATFYRWLFYKTCHLQARARGEATS